eukprot:TRINITY_DN14115_c0_g1_i5.p1 TRINITY_DN14115_c0_g1~~TRINITY_DN14115_c0_g1_i5.p1  ORF type:complete len:330 (-),score=21.70 TRINITY_DN14115_c0_g1_i5:181-1125(-)
MGSRVLLIAAALLAPVVEAEQCPNRTGHRCEMWPHYCSRILHGDGVFCNDEYECVCGDGFCATDDQYCVASEGANGSTPSARLSRPCNICRSVAGAVVHFGGGHGCAAACVHAAPGGIVAYGLCAALCVVVERGICNGARDCAADLCHMIDLCPKMPARDSCHTCLGIADAVTSSGSKLGCTQSCAVSVSATDPVGLAMCGMLCEFAGEGFCKGVTNCAGKMCHRVGACPKPEDTRCEDCLDVASSIGQEESQENCADSCADQTSTPEDLVLCGLLCSALGAGLCSGVEDCGRALCGAVAACPANATHTRMIQV